MTVERFREAFPRARWSDERRSWFVPGKTAARRVDRWLAREAELLATHADSKGRDAFAFDPISSRYLEIAEDLRIRTPYSMTVVRELREIPWASWDDELRAWRVPFRSYEELRRRWPTIEEAARRSEPEERKRRREAQKDSEAQRATRLRYAERRRQRYRCRLKTCLRWAAPSQQSSTVLSSLPMCQVKSSSRQNWLPSIHMRCGQTSTTCGERGARRR